MCNIDATEVKKIVQDKIAAGESFTAFDITKSMRQSGVFYHNDVREIVHDMFRNDEMPGYDRVHGNFPNVGVQPWLYQPVAVDPTDAHLDTISTPADDDSMFPDDPKSGSIIDNIVGVFKKLGLT